MARRCSVLVLDSGDCEGRMFPKPHLYLVYRQQPILVSLALFKSEELLRCGTESIEERLNTGDPTVNLAFSGGRVGTCALQ
jgi:hypothetical protein